MRKFVALAILVLSIFTIEASASQITVHPGETITLDNFRDTNNEYFNDFFTPQTYILVPKFTVGAKYVESVFMQNGTIKLRVKAALPKTQEPKYIQGSITLIYRFDKSREYTTEIGIIDIDESLSSSAVMHNGVYTLPWDYQYVPVSFDHLPQTGKSAFIGTFEDGTRLTTSFYSWQSPIFFGHNTEINPAVMTKYNKNGLIDMRFINFTSKASLVSYSTITISKMIDEYIYEVLPNNTLREVNGTYNTTTGDYTFPISKLGSYCITSSKVVGAEPALIYNTGNNDNTKPSKPTSQSSSSSSRSSSSASESNGTSESSSASGVSSNISSQASSSSINEISSSQASSTSNDSLVSSSNVEKNNNNFYVITIITLCTLLVIAVVFAVFFWWKGKSYSSWGDNDEF